MSADPGRVRRRDGLPDPGGTPLGHGLLAAFGAAVFGLVCWSLTSVLPLPGMHVLGPKLLHLSEAIDDYDTWFVGSSRTYRALIPTVYDEQMAARGRKTHSFNLGVPGMRVPEAVFVLKTLLDRQPQRLRRVVFEVQTFDASINPGNVMTDRMIWWHDAQETWAACRSVLTEQRPWSEKRQEILMHARHFVFRFTNAGRGLALIPLLRTSTGNTDEWVERFGMLAGFLPLEREPKGMYNVRHQGFLEQIELYRRKLALLRRGEPDDGELTAYQRELFQRVLDEAEIHGIEVVFAVMPSVEREDAILRAHEAGLLRRLIVLNDPARYPDLYAEEARFDMRHLKTLAARECTRHFVAALAALDAPDGEN